MGVLLSAKVIPDRPRTPLGFVPAGAWHNVPERKLGYGDIAGFTLQNRRVQRGISYHRGTQGRFHAANGQGGHPSDPPNTFLAR